MHKRLCEESLPNRSLEDIEQDIEGLFVLTFDELLKTETHLLERSIMFIDEAHMYLNQ